MNKGLESIVKSNNGSEGKPSIETLDKAKPIYPEHVERLTFALTYDCDLNCPRHCARHMTNIRNRYVNDSMANMPLELVTASLTLFKDLKEINFYGGEPTMNPQLEAMVGEARRYRLDLNRPGLRIRMITNGLSLPDDRLQMIEELKKYPEITIQMSISSYHQDAYRFLGQDCLEKAEDLASLSKEPEIKNAGTIIEFFYTLAPSEFGRGAYIARYYKELLGCPVDSDQVANPLDGENIPGAVHVRNDSFSRELGWENGTRLSINPFGHIYARAFDMLNVRGDSGEDLAIARLRYD